MLVKAKLKRLLSTQRTHSWSRAGLSTPFVGRFYILNKIHNWTFLLHEFFFFPFFFARIFFLGIFPYMNFFFWLFPHPPPPPITFLMVRPLDYCNALLYGLPKEQIAKLTTRAKCCRQINYGSILSAEKSRRESRQPEIRLRSQANITPCSTLRSTLATSTSAHTI